MNDMVRKIDFRITTEKVLMDKKGRVTQYGLLVLEACFAVGFLAVSGVGLILKHIMKDAGER